MSNQTPNVVWLDKHKGQIRLVTYQCGCCPTKPYVNIDWFLAEVERRIKQSDGECGCDYCWRDAMRLTAKAIKEGKA